MLGEPILHPDKHATIASRRLKTIAQFKYYLILLTITATEGTIRSYTKVIVGEKQKLIDSLQELLPLPRSLVQLMNLIATRRSLDEIINNEHETIEKSFKNASTSIPISTSDQRATDFFVSIKDLLQRLYTG